MFGERFQVTRCEMIMAYVNNYIVRAYICVIIVTSSGTWRTIKVKIIVM